MCGMEINTLEELKTFRDFLITKGKTKYSIREALRVADIVYPWIDGIMEDHRVRYLIPDEEDYLQFDIDLPAWGKFEEMFEYPPPLEIGDFIWDYVKETITFYMEEYAPDCENYIMGDLWTASILVEHDFNWSGGGWDGLSVREKLEHLYYNDVAIFSVIEGMGLIDDLNEVIFWLEFEEEVKKLEDYINSEEYAECIIEDIKINFEECLIKELEEV